MKSYVVHLKNKYPGAQVHSSESAIDVYHQGEHVVSVRKDANGHWNCAKDDVGARDKFDLAPIPKDARAFKLYANGKVGPSEEFKEREEKQLEYLAVYGKVPSNAELEAEAKAKK
jgi:hypothetical protein